MWHTKHSGQPKEEGERCFSLVSSTWQEKQMRSLEGIPASPPGVQTDSFWFPFEKPWGWSTFALIYSLPEFSVLFLVVSAAVAAAACFCSLTSQGETPLPMWQLAGRVTPGSGWDSDNLECWGLHVSQVPPMQQLHSVDTKRKRWGNCLPYSLSALPAICLSLPSPAQMESGEESTMSVAHTRELVRHDTKTQRQKTKQIKWISKLKYFLLQTLPSIK